MLKKFWLFSKFGLFIFLLILSLRYGEDVSVTAFGVSVNFHLSVLVLAVGIFGLVISAIKNFLNSIFSKFWKSPEEKGLENLQIAFSRMLLKDKSQKVEKYLEKSKKYLGNLPIISWLEGQFHLMKGEDHIAKGLFYSLFTQEKKTAFGAFGLYNLAVKENSPKDALLSIDSLSKFVPSPSLCFTAITLALKNKNFEAAKKYIDGLKNTKKFKIVRAILLSEEGFLKNDTDLLKKAFKIKPDFTENTLRYADALLQKEKIRKAKKILQESFELNPNLEIFKKYMSIEKREPLSKFLKYGEAFANLVSKSWVGYFGVAEIAMSEKIYPVAFSNFYKSYQNAPYDFIATKLLESAKLLNDPKPPEAIQILSQPLPSQCANFTWECDHCGTIEKQWISICKNCSRIGEYQYINLSEKNQKTEESNELTQLSDYSI